MNTGLMNAGPVNTGPINAERLLELYDRVADAPNAVARLRRFVLDLAVRGKLVPQDPSDEPAEELLKRIEAEKKRMVREGEVKRSRWMKPESGNGTALELPHGWKATYLGEVIELLSGQHLKPSEYSEEPDAGVPYITGPSDVSDRGRCISRYALLRKAVARQGELLLTVKGSGVGKTTICDLPEVAISRQLMAITPIGCEVKYLEIITDGLAIKLQEQARSLIPGISRDDVKNYLFPLPPLAEQRRIAAMVDYMMSRLGWLKVAIATVEVTKQRLLESLTYHTLYEEHTLE